MHDLSEPEDGVIEAIVEAVDEDENSSLRNLFDGAPDPAARLGQAHQVSLERHEIRSWVARNAFRPLNVTRLPVALRRDRHCELGKGQSGPALPGEVLGRI